MSEKSCLRGPFHRQHGKQAQTLLKYEQHHLHHDYWSMQKQLSWEKPLLMISKISRLFVNILAANDKYSLFNGENLTQPIRMQLYEKQQTFPQFFTAVLKSRLSFEDFQEKDDPHSWCIFVITDSQKRG